MTATSRTAFSQSSFERRLPSITSTAAPLSCRRIDVLSLVKLLDGLTRQRTLVNPSASRCSTTLEPMNPAAPVTRTRSCFVIICFGGPRCIQNNSLPTRMVQQRIFYSDRAFRAAFLKLLMNKETQTGTSRSSKFEEFNRNFAFTSKRWRSLQPAPGGKPPSQLPAIS